MKQGPNYYLRLARADYYLKGGEPEGQWFGRGTTDPRINLSDTVRAKPLKNLLRRYSPNANAPLTQIQKHKDKATRQGYDLTFSSSKSFSTQWSQADRVEREILQYIHAIAVRKGLSYLEDNACFVRRGKTGTELEKAKAIIAVFTHGTSRAGDPNYHSHCLWMHTAIGVGGKPGTIESRPLFQHMRPAGAIFRAEETRLLKEIFGLEIERDKSCYRIKGVPKELEREFSKRSEAIKAWLRERGLSGAKAAAEATLKTRRKKDDVPRPREELLAEWKETGTRLGWGPDEARRLFQEGEKRRRKVKEDHTDWENEVTKDALMKLTTNQSSFAKRDLVRFLAEESQTRGIGSDRVLELAKETLGTPEVVRLGTTQHDERFTTKELLAIEKSMLDQASIMSRATGHKVSVEVRSRVTQARPNMSAEQKVSLEHATSGNAIAVIEGDAGTGKTYLLSAVREAYERSGYTVLGAALAGVAADGLRDGAGIKDSRTIAKLLLDIRRGETRLTGDTVLILDEAAMVGTRQLAELIRAASGRAKIILAGDTKQLQSIEAGGAFKAIGDEIGSSRLTDVIRQRDEWQRQAAKHFAAGDPAAGLKAYRDHGLLRVTPKRKAAIRMLVGDWMRLKKSQENSLIFCGTNLDAVTINRLCQKARLGRGEIGKKRIEVGGEMFHLGDRVLFTKNWAKLAVRNGNIGTVTAINLLRREITVSLGDSKNVVIPLKRYSHIKHGYCVTTHKGQGKTVENAFVLLGGTMQDREISYVQTSRSRGDTRLYCDTEDTELKDLIRQMERSHQKELGTTIMNQAKSIKQSR
jgi:conjugative relaxase-like TrwC/TraI family protein